MLVREKIKEFQAILRKKKIDIFISCSLDFNRFDYDMSYFSGYNGVGILAIPSEKKPFLAVSRMERERAGKGGIKAYSPPKGTRLSEFISDMFRQRGIRARRAGINPEMFTLQMKDIFKKSVKKSRFLGLQKELYRLKEQKTEEEIAIIRKGCRISDSILKECFKRFKDFKTEADVKAFLENEARKMGCELAFPTIVASGKNSRMAHHSTEDTALKKGFCVIDFGIRYRNYCTDTTRTIYLGRPSCREKEIYQLLLDVQRKAIRKARAGIRCSELFDDAHRDLGRYSRNFTHGLGHGFGIKIHELPNLAGGIKEGIKENSVFTIEPGVYLKEFGIRIEDDILVRKGKTEVLTKAGKDLLIIS
ncbi:Xaa-Pro peptidase family protein [Candidatus Woesearchaeota archaeon]|nr:Xaa-Pro peptidase family protein [Candidatus Woesearchaeota archaeon]